MKTSILPNAASSSSASQVSAGKKLHGMDRLARKLVLKLLAKIQTGELTLIEHGHSHHFGCPMSGGAGER